MHNKIILILFLQQKFPTMMKIWYTSFVEFLYVTKYIDVCIGKIVFGLYLQKVAY